MGASFAAQSGGDAAHVFFAFAALFAGRRERRLLVEHGAAVQGLGGGVVVAAGAVGEGLGQRGAGEQVGVAVEGDGLEAGADLVPAGVRGEGEQAGAVAGVVGVGLVAQEQVVVEAALEVRPADGERREVGGEVSWRGRGRGGELQGQRGGAVGVAGVAGCGLRSSR